MSDDQIRAVALFFHFAFLHDALALQAAQKALSLLRRRAGKNKIYSQTQIVEVTWQVFLRYKKSLQRIKPRVGESQAWLLPSIDFAPWRQFHKESEEGERLALIWSKILGLSDQDVALGLGVSTGTVRFRVGNALRRLGSLSRFRTLADH